MWLTPFSRHLTKAVSVVKRKCHNLKSQEAFLPIQKNSVFYMNFCDHCLIIKRIDNGSTRFKTGSRNFWFTQKL